MAPAALYGYGSSKPPKTPRRRLWWAIAVFVLCATILPFVIFGIVQAGADGRTGEAIGLVVMLVPLVIGVVAALYAAVDIARSHRRAARAVEPE